MNRHHQHSRFTLGITACACVAVPMFAGPLAAQPARAPAVSPTPPATLPVQAPASPTAPGATAPGATAPGPTDPQRTTATFGDWIVRCEQTPTGVKVCEAAQIAANPQGQPAAQVAFGRVIRSEPMRMTMLVPPSVLLTTAPRFLGRDGDKSLPTVDFTWRRCLPGGCLADAVPGEEGMTKFRALTEQYRMVFQDGAGRDATVPFSPKGLPQALDALAKEEPR